MTAIRKHLGALTAFAVLLWTSPAVARAGEQGSPGGMSVRVVRNGKPITAMAMVLHGGSQPKGADISGNVGTFKEEDVEERRRGGILLLDESRDGSVSALFVLDSVIAPPAALGSARRNLGAVTIGRGVSLVVDAGTGTVTDVSQPSAPSAQPTTAATANPTGSAGYRYSPRFTVSGSGGFSNAISSLSFCDDNATRLRAVNAVQSNCGYDTSSTAFNVSGALRFASVGGWDLAGAGGYASFGRTRPEALGTAPTFTINRSAREKFRGGWAGVGLWRHWSSWSLQPTVGVAYLRRDTDTTDTFTRLADRAVVENSISRRDKDVQPIGALSLYRKVGPYFSFGTTYTFTRFRDDLKNQSLHGIQAGLQVAFGS
jgi:hypothetical protein